MNHPQAKEQLFDATFLLGAWRRRRALKFLLEQGDLEAVRILVDAVDRQHAATTAIQRFLAGLTSREAVTALAQAWAGQHRPWLGSIAVERALSAGAGAALPLDRETAWLVSPHLRRGGAPATAAEAYVQRALQAQPPFLGAFIFKLGRGHVLQRDCASGAGVLALLADPDNEVRAGAQTWLEAKPAAAPPSGPLITLRQHSEADSARTLVEAVDRRPPGSAALPQFLAGLTAPESVEAVVAAWAERRRSWLGPIAVERALSVGRAATLPLDRETAWLVVPHLPGGGARAQAAEAYVQRALQAQPEFLPALVFKLGRGPSLERARPVQAWALRLLADEDPDVRAGAQAWLKALPNTQQWNDLMVDEWIRNQSPFLTQLVAEPRLPSNPAKEALLHLANRNVAAYRKLEDRDGALLTEALAMASPELRKVINEVVLQAKDGALADAYRRATGAGSPADPQLALRALMAAGNEDALFDAARGLTLAEVLPLCRHWAETKRRPRNERHREIVDHAAAALERLPELAIEPAPPLPAGLVDLLEQWHSETVPDAQLRQDLSATDPFLRARALWLGSQRGLVDDPTLRQRAASEHWPERLAVALHSGRAPSADPVQWLNDCAGTDGGLLGARLQCGPEELQRSQALCAALRDPQGALAVRHLALAQILAAFRTLSGGAIRVREDDSAPVPTGTRQHGAVPDQDL